MKLKGESYATRILWQHDMYWNEMKVIVMVAESKQKEVPSSEGMKRSAVL